MLSSQWTLVLGFTISVFSQQIPDPLPLITPPDVVNLFIQDSDDAAGDLVASVIAAVSLFSVFGIQLMKQDSTAATFLIIVLLRHPADLEHGIIQLS
jgi:hypothetical protein